MKKIILFISIFVISMTINAQELKPTKDLLLFKVLVTNMDDYPMNGNRISFVNVENGHSYSGVSNLEGRFEVLIPKGERLEVRANFLGEDSVLRIIEPINTDGAGTINYKLKYRVPHNVVLKGIYFDTNKSILKPSSNDALYNLLEYLSDKLDVKVEIGGHTDSVGDEESNMKLSQKRAESVCKWLESKGVSSDRIQAKGYGETKPVASNDTPEGRASNRRTEITVIGGDSAVDGDTVVE